MLYSYQSLHECHLSDKAKLFCVNFLRRIAVAMVTFARRKRVYRSSRPKKVA